MLKHRYIVPIFTALTLGFLLSYLFLNGSLHALWVMGLLFLCIVTWGAFDIRLSYFVPTYSEKKSEKNRRIAITFDDGPTIHTQAILRLLQQYNAKATFFCIGQEIVKQPQCLKDIHNQQHTIGNHTYTHANNTGFLSTDQMLEEIEKNDRIIAETIGVKPLLYRPPFGVTNPNIAKALAKSGHSVIGWSIRSLDTVINSEEKILKKVISKVKPGSVILFHDTTEKTVHIVEQLLLFLHTNKYQCVSIDDLLDIKAYEGCDTDKLHETEL